MKEENLLRRRYCKDVVIVSELFFKAWEGERSGGTEDGDKRRNERLQGILHSSQGMKEEIR